MLRYGFIAAGNIIRAMHRGAEMNKDYNPAEIGIYDINEEVRKVMQQEDKLHLIT